MDKSIEVEESGGGKNDKDIMLASTEANEKRSNSTDSKSSEISQNSEVISTDTSIITERAIKLEEDVASTSIPCEEITSIEEENPIVPKTEPSKDSTSIIDDEMSLLSVEEDAEVMVTKFEISSKTVEINSARSAIDTIDDNIEVDTIEDDIIEEDTIEDDTESIIETIEDANIPATIGQTDEATPMDIDEQSSAKLDNISIEDKVKIALKDLATHNFDFGSIIKTQTVIVDVDEKMENKSNSIFHNKSCLHDKCDRTSNDYFIAPTFIENYYGVRKNDRNKKKYYVCESCYKTSLRKYEYLCQSLGSEQETFLSRLPESQTELVEISDSSEDEGDDDKSSEDDSPLSPSAIEMIETNLNDLVQKTCTKYNVAYEFEQCINYINEKSDININKSKEQFDTLAKLEDRIRAMSNELYACANTTIKELAPVDVPEHGVMSTRTIDSNKIFPNGNPSKINSVFSLDNSPKGNSSVAEYYPPLRVGSICWGVRTKLLSQWVKCRIIECFKAENTDSANFYKVEYLSGKDATNRIISGNQLAYLEELKFKLQIGTRVIGRFQPETHKSNLHLVQNCFFPGVVAEPVQTYNMNRYLIFFDDGYVQYVMPKDCRVVCEKSKNIWDDVHIHSREFIKNFLTLKLQQKAMVQVRKGQKMMTESNSRWVLAKVVGLDASLVHMHFEDENRYEWIYRGSKRFAPIYRGNAHSTGTQLQKRNEPSIEYITIEDDDNDNETKKIEEIKKNLNQSIQPVRAVAKKSSAMLNKNQPPQQQSTSTTPRFMNNSTIFMDDEPKGKVVYYAARKNLPPLKYRRHECDPKCLFPITNNLKSYSQLAKPLLTGWERQIIKVKSRKFVQYKGPCGRLLRNIAELHNYLRVTRSPLNVENFDYDSMIHCLAEYVIEKSYYSNPDLSNGKEGMPIACVNYYDNSKPPECVYSTERIPTEGVNLNLDPEFLCGCDCTDDCSDKRNCACWKLTLAGAKFTHPNFSIDNIGYYYKKLHDSVQTGIYECNSRCKCNQKCLNRVVQHPLQAKLQVFKTANRGWGIRTLSDVSKGTFICIYSGHLLTEEKSIEICRNSADKHADEYFAELDYIEIVEGLKNDYEQEVVMPEEMEEKSADEEEEVEEAEEDNQWKNTDNGMDSDDDFRLPLKVKAGTAITTRSRARTVKKDSKKSAGKSMDISKPKETAAADAVTISDDEERELINLTPKIALTKDDEQTFKYNSVRAMFGKHENVYIMDAKKSGNIGRYFNHSCNPNLNVQNVFVDTHDLRFPWVSFFASTNIRAGTELTWNYNYDVGSVADKVLFCQCGSQNCRKRLL